MSDSSEKPIIPPLDDEDAASQATPVRPERLDPYTARTVQRRRTLSPSSPSAQVLSGRPANRYEAPVEEAPAEPQSISAKTIITGLASLVILAIVVGFVYVRYFYKSSTDPGTIVPGSGSSQLKVDRPDEVVRRYLQALSDGDVETALRYGPLSGQGSKALLTKTIYEHSSKSHRITDIKVPNTDPTASEVNATYKMGGENVSSKFRMRRTDDGNWQLAQSTITVRLDIPGTGKLPLIINGTQVPSENPVFELLPGFYSVETGLPYVTYPASSAILLNSLEYEGTTVRALNPTLTEAGEKVIAKLARNSLAFCMSQTSLTPPNCPNKVNTLQPVNPSSITWQLLGDPFANAHPTLNSGDASVGELSLTLQFLPNWTYADGSTPGRQPTRPVSARMSTSLLATTESELKAIWHV